MDQPRIFIVPFSHLDLGFLGDREQSLSRGQRITGAAIEIIRKHPEFRFMLEDMVFVQDYVDCHPELLAELRDLVHAGKIEMGAKWAGIYQNMQYGEGLVRNQLYGVQYVRDTFGIDPDTVHLGDLPGYTPQYPQILAKGGVKGVIICRSGPSDCYLYHWRSPDGSSVLCWNALKGYHWSWARGLHRSVDEALQNGLEQEARQIAAPTPGPILMHWGIDLAAPTEQLVPNVEEWNRRSDLKARFATASEYFAAVQGIPTIPTISGEIPSVWSQLESDVPHLWPLSQEAFFPLIAAENWSELARRLGFGGYPAHEIKEAWKILLQGMDHNGGGGFLGSNRNREYQIMARMTAEELLRVALRKIAENIKIPIDDPWITPIIVFNSTSWMRSETVTANLAFHGPVESFYGSINNAKFGDVFRHVKLYDHTGQVVPFQILAQQPEITRQIQITFPANEVPAFGYKLYYVLPCQEPEDTTPCCQISGTEWHQTLVVESQRLRLEVDRPTGRVSVLDKALGRPIINGTDLVAEENRIDRHWFRYWKTGRPITNAVDKIEVAENGPVRARITITGRIGSMPTLQEWILYADASYVDVIDHIEWTGHPAQILVQRVLPTEMEAPQMVYGVPFGANDWENKQPNIGSHNDDEYPDAVSARFREIVHWIDLSANGRGLTVASTRRIVERDGMLLKVNLARGGGPGRQFANVTYSDKSFSMTTRLAVHDGDWRASRAYRTGMALNLPLLGLSEHDPVTAKRLEPVACLCAVPAENVLITTIKRAEVGEATIVRGFEVEGRAVSATPTLSPNAHAMSEVNLLEEQPTPVNDVVWQPCEIKTLKID